MSVVSHKIAIVAGWLVHFDFLSALVGDLDQGNAEMIGLGYNRYFNRGIVVAPRPIEFTCYLLDVYGGVLEGGA